MIEHQRGQICFRCPTSAIGHRRSVKLYRSPLVAFEVLWFFRRVRGVFLKPAHLKELINSTTIMKGTYVFMSRSPSAPPSPPHPLAHIRMTMLRMRLPILRVLRG